jgi:tetratricopeptide (TPR) repeat protein
MRRLVGGLLLLALTGACSQYQLFESEEYVKADLESRIPEDLRGLIDIPYHLDDETLAELDSRLSPLGNEKRRTEAIVDFIFSGLELEYSLTPTRNASETFRVREGNCLSFVNLFVGIARLQRLNPFYVEVEDYQRWHYSEGVVVSRGHIVAGMTVDGELSTFDFLPYRTKGYRDFEPIDDLAAMAHYYNNLGAEALMVGDLDRAEPNLRIATALAPDFEKAINNLGVVHLRRGRTEEALALYERALEIHPGNIPLLTNLARVLQDLGRADEAIAVMAQIEDVNLTNPFFFVYRGELALGMGDSAGALEYMRKALRIDSEQPEVHVGLLKVFLALGDVAKARHHLERALRLDATHDEARKYAAMLSAGATGR